MTRILGGFTAVAVGVMIIMKSAAVLMAIPKAAPPSVFTTEQAEAGRAAYATNCASCHMPDLSGDNEKPPLAGPIFMTNWRSRSTKELLEYVSGAMPFDAPALSPETYRAIIAFVLQSNGATPGTQALAASTDVLIGAVTAGSGSLSPSAASEGESK